MHRLTGTDETVRRHRTTLTGPHPQISANKFDPHTAADAAPVVATLP
jgi:hypothetical protein